MLLHYWMIVITLSARPLATFSWRWQYLSHVVFVVFKFVIFLLKSIFYHLIRSIGITQNRCFEYGCFALLAISSIRL